MNKLKNTIDVVRAKVNSDECCCLGTDAEFKDEASPKWPNDEKKSFNLIDKTLFQIK